MSFTDAELVDLAGNAFTGAVVTPLWTALVATGPLKAALEIPWEKVAGTLDTPVEPAAADDDMYEGEESESGGPEEVEDVQEFSSDGEEMSPGGQSIASN